MKPKLIYMSLALLFSGFQVEAQLLEKLKQRAEEKGLETNEVSYDTTDNAKNRSTSYQEEEMVVNSARDYFTKAATKLLFNQTDTK